MQDIFVNFLLFILPRTVFQDIRTFEYYIGRLNMCVHSWFLVGGGGGGTSPSFNERSALVLLLSTSTYSFSETEDSPSLAPGVGGNCPGIGGTSPCPCLHPDGGLPSPVFGRLAVTGLPNSDANGLVALAAFVGLCANVSPSGVLAFGLDRPEGDLLDAAAFRRSSVARRRASRASSSEVCEDTAFFLRGWILS